MISYVLLAVVGCVAAAPFAFEQYVRWQTRKYVKNLTKPDVRYNKSHASKPICPYMGNVLGNRGLTVRYIHPFFGWSGIEAQCRELIQAQDRDSVKSAAIVICPFLSYERLIAIWLKVRREAIREGKMFGEFHPSRKQVGLHSDTVFPLATPFPMFGIRTMVRQDIDFFAKFENDPKVLSEFEQIWETRFGSRSQASAADLIRQKKEAPPSVDNTTQRSFEESHDNQRPITSNSSSISTLG